MVESNRDRLLEIGVLGEVVHPLVGKGYLNDWEGRPGLGLGQGGIVYNVKPGDSVFGWAMGEKVEPGVALDGVGEDRAKGSFRNYTCVGNEAKVVSGEAKGAKGVVVGKVGGLPDRAHHVVAHFGEEDLEKLAIGDKVQVRSVGVGLSFPSYPDIRLVGLSPQLLDAWGLAEEGGRVKAPVTTVVPPEYVGMGSGGAPAEASSWNVMTQSPDAVEYLAGVRIGDLVALKDILSAWGRGYYEGAVTVGVVSTGASRKLGHGFNVTTLMTCRTGQLEPVLDPEANISRLLGLGGGVDA